MLPGSLLAGLDAQLISPVATQHGRIANSTGSATMLRVVSRRVGRVLSVWRKRVAARRTLADLDDYLLRDVGLTQADVERELMKPFWRA